MLDLFEFETTMEAEPAPAGDTSPAEPEPTPEPQPEGEPEGGDATPDAALAGGFDESAFRQAVAEEADAIVQARLAQVLPQFMPPPGATPGPMSGQFDWTQVDPYSDEFGAQLGQGIQATIQQALEASLGPVTQSLEQAQQSAALEQGEQVAQDMISDSLARGGDVTDEGKNAIRGLAEAFMPEAVGRYGESPKAAEMAIETAVNVIRQIEQAAAQKAVAQHTNHVATLAGANGEPGIGTSGVGTIPGAAAAQDALAGRSSLAQRYGTKG